MIATLINAFSDVSLKISHDSSARITREIGQDLAENSHQMADLA
ncbi:hypothetical protein UCMB321_1167 [Pseudomonas batumici]|uniref:Uncharacterized protein n=1 Tax=Pseudomonas batumici TaxID=226910 RepID=A0A0C2EGP3_9PSED|nr:hypothetical protein UCMB321_1167 [Pseudomonas batumici]